MICPFAMYRPVQNHGGAMSAHLGLVLHEQEGNGSLYGYFNTPSSQVSSHFWVSKTGTLEQYVDTDSQSWAQEAGNATYLSVETEGFQTEPLTSLQILVVAELLVWSSEEYGFPRIGPVPHGQAGLTPHCNPNGTPDPNWGNHPCPGSIRLGQMLAIVESANPPLPTEEDEMNAVVVTENGVTTVLIYAASPQGHLLEFSRRPGNNQFNSVIDITAGIGGANPYLVAP